MILAPTRGLLSGHPLRRVAGKEKTQVDNEDFGPMVVGVDMSTGEDCGCTITGFVMWGDLYIWDVEYTEPRDA